MSWMEEDNNMCIPGLGENRQRPHSGRPDSASSEWGSRGKRCTRGGGAGDSSQMANSLAWCPPTPTQPVQEEPFVAVDAGNSVEATPFFTSSASTILIRGGKVINAEDEEQEADVLVVEGVITRVEQGIDPPEGAMVIEASGKYVIPGGVDPSTHLLRGLASATLADDLATSTRAALAGGTTTVVDLVLPERGESLIDAYATWKTSVEESTCCDVVLSVAIPEVTEEAKAEMEKLAKGLGVNTFKIFLSQPGRFMLENEQILDVLKHIKKVGGVACVHAENGEVVARTEQTLLQRGVVGPEGFPLAHSEEAEEEATRRVCTIAHQVNVPLCVSGVSSAAAAEVINEFKAKGLEVVGEVRGASLLLDSSHYQNKCWQHAAAFVCSPPLRADREELQAALAAGQLDAVSSQNCVYASKYAGRDDFSKIPEGLNGIEERMSVVYTSCVAAGQLDLKRFVEVTSTAPARYLNLYPRKGCIAEGSDADIVIWNPLHTHTVSHRSHQSQAGFNVLEGAELVGGAEFVLTGGRIAVAEFQINAIPGSGRLVSAPAFPPAYERIRDKDRAVRLVPVERKDVPQEETKPAEPDTFGMTTPRGYFQGQVLNKDLGIFQRPLSAHGVRNQQDSTFSLTGPHREREIQSARGRPNTAVKINAPPGGRSDSFW